MAMMGHLRPALRGGEVVTKARAAGLVAEVRAMESGEILLRCYGDWNTAGTRKARMAAGPFGPFSDRVRLRTQRLTPDSIGLFLVAES